MKNLILFLMILGLAGATANGQIPFEVSKTDTNGYVMSWQEMPQNYDGYVVWSIPKGRPPYRIAVVSSTDYRGAGRHWYQIRGRLGAGCHAFRVAGYYKKEGKKFDEIKMPPDDMSNIHYLCIKSDKERT